MTLYCDRSSQAKLYVSEPGIRDPPERGGCGVVAASPVAYTGACAGNPGRWADHGLGNDALASITTWAGCLLVSEEDWSGRQDSNLRLPAPKAGALPG